MGRLFILFSCLAFFSITACFSDDETNGSTDSFLEATIEGDVVAFDQMLLTEVTTADETFTYRRVTGSIRDDSSKKINLHLYENVTGNAAIFYIEYTVSGILFTSEEEGATLNGNITKNETEAIAGSFSGVLKSEVSGEEISITLTNGTFEIYN